MIAAKPLRATLLAILIDATVSQQPVVDFRLVPPRWWCAASRGNSESIFCRSAALREAIAMAVGAAEKQARVDELKAAILGNLLSGLKLAPNSFSDTAHARVPFV